MNIDSKLVVSKQIHSSTFPIPLSSYYSLGLVTIDKVIH